MAKAKFLKRVVFEINAIHCYSCFFPLYPQNLGLSYDYICALVKLEPCQERFVLVSECSTCNESIFFCYPVDIFFSLFPSWFTRIQCTFIIFYT